MNKKGIKNLRDLIEYSITKAVNRFEGSALHVESIMNEVLSDRDIRNIRTGSISEINIFLKNKETIKANISELLKGVREKEIKPKKPTKKTPQIKGKINDYTPSEKERVLKSVKAMNSKDKDKAIKELYPYKNPSSLNELEYRVLEIISKIHDVGMITILSKYRGIEAVEARTQYMVLLYNLFGYTTVEVGKTLSRDHSTVIHSKDSHDTILEINQNKAYVDNFNRVLLELEKEFPAFFNIDEDKVQEINRKYERASRYNKERKHKIIGELKLSDLILKELRESKQDGKETN